MIQQASDYSLKFNMAAEKITVSAISHAFPTSTKQQKSRPWTETELKYSPLYLWTKITSLHIDLIACSQENR